MIATTNDNPINIIIIIIIIIITTRKY